MDVTFRLCVAPFDLFRVLHSNRKITISFFNRQNFVTSLRRYCSASWPYNVALKFLQIK